MADPETDDGTLNRKRATLAVLPFLALGVGNVLLILGWGLDGIWGFLLLPPVLFICVLAWIAFRTGFVNDRTGDVTGTETDTGR